MEQNVITDAIEDFYASSSSSDNSMSLDHDHPNYTPHSCTTTNFSQLASASSKSASLVSLQTDSCFVCQKGSLYKDTNEILCNHCNLKIKAPEERITVDTIFHTLVQLSSNHSQVCMGMLLFVYAEETGLTILCSHCEEVLVID